MLLGRIHHLGLEPIGTLLGQYSLAYRSSAIYGRELAVPIYIFPSNNALFRKFITADLLDGTVRQLRYEVRGGSATDTVATDKLLSCYCHSIQASKRYDAQT